MDGLEDKHTKFSELYLYSLINLEKFDTAYKFSKKLERKEVDSFESNLIISIYYLKKKNYEKAIKYLKNINTKKKNCPFKS